MQEDEQSREFARQCLSGTTGVAEEKTYEISARPVPVPAAGRPARGVPLVKPEERSVA